MTHLAHHHAAVADPFAIGLSAECVCLLMSGASGMDWMFQDGGAALLRRTLYPEPAPWEYCGVAQQGEVVIRNYASFGHVADQAYHYAAQRFLGNGMVSRMTPPIRLDFDGAGALITPSLPAPVVGLAATPIAGGKFAITFAYDPWGQGGSPADFQVFAGADAGSVDYGTALTDSVTGLNRVDFAGAQRTHTFTTAAFADGTARVFVVRGRNINGVAEKNTRATRVAVAKASLPPDAPAAQRATIGATSRTAG